ncbi:IclR family transcriptional regulator [Sinorhizobium mexicanum]|uniref:IclR family transcriptional regulator n=1 Tax=Sinorhizobium mexicanum TaxID=375549 RepID=A0A859R7H5_9HYPH|nr:IclR family transcriptional regulator [Sinorhizobium mexicanum]MBP1884504.1 DNA-binding IclR family transcriptional regulator [Sinorhizobium mexicanum]QLL65418.1 IclR family transcriptional regulator [Sinorhizobium mexicanum]
MSDENSQDDKDKNGVPVLERMMEILSSLELQPAGETIRGLSEQLSVPRSTVYRILNTLHAHNVVQRRLDGTYVLGPRLLSLASKVRSEATFDLLAVAQPAMKKLADLTGEANKLSVLDNQAVVVVAAFAGQGQYALNPAVGQAFPLHAGAASKLLLAHMTPEAIAKFLATPLQKYTPRTITDPAKLSTELNRIRKQGWASDRGEHGGSVWAIAAPITAPSGRVIAALSIPYLAADKENDERDRLRDLVVESAAEISSGIPDI